MTKIINLETSNTEIDEYVNNKDRYVLKLGNGSGGVAVFIGRETEPDRWRRLIEVKQLEGSWVIQEFTESLPFTYLNLEGELVDHNAIWGFFMNGTNYSGAFVRLSERDNSLVINSAQGARETYLLEIN